MRPMTYYRALLLTQSNMTRVAESRGTRFGIAVDNDSYAHCWQRYNRLFNKLDDKMREILTSVKPSKNLNFKIWEDNSFTLYDIARCGNCNSNSFKNSIDGTKIKCDGCGKVYIIRAS